LRARNVWATCWEDALLAEREGKLGYTPAGIGRERVPVATVQDSDVDFVAIVQEVGPAARGKAAPTLVE